MSTEELQAQKLQLEIDKLRSDISKSDKSFLRTSDFWKSIIPVVITTGGLLATLYFTVGRSFIDDEKRRLELQKEQLKLEVMQFEYTKQDIKKDIITSTIDKNQLQNQIKKLEYQKSILGKNISTLSNQANELKGENAIIKSTYQKDKLFYQTELKNTYRIEKIYLNQLAAIQDSINRKDVIISELSAVDKYFRNKVNLSKNEQLELEGHILTASANEHGKIANKYHKQVDEIERKYKEESKKSETKTAEELERFFELYFLRSESVNK